MSDDMRSSRHERQDRAGEATSATRGEGKHREPKPDHGRVDVADPHRTSWFEIHRWVFIALGVLCFALGAIGVFVPGLPTTVFLLIGSFLLARSCPGLRDRLLAHRVLAPYRRYVEPGGVIRHRDRVVALTGMWSAILLSTAGLTLFTASPVWVLVAVPACGLLGSWYILRVWGR